MTIIKKVKEIKEINSLLIMGSVGSGKSWNAIEACRNMKKVLFITFSNVPQGLPDTWDVGVVTDWTDFEKDVLSVARQGKLQYEAVVLDGYDKALMLLSPADRAPTQPEWGHMAKRFIDAATAVKYSGIDRFVVTVKLVEDDSGVKKLDITPRARNSLIDMFSEKWYTYGKPSKDGGILYDVQQTAILAVNFRTK
jgi:hypothetical protein